MADLLSLDESALAQLPLDTLLSALGDSDSEARACAIYALGTRHEPEAISALVNVCSDHSSFLARIAAEFFREPDPQLGFLWGGLTMGMLLSVPMIAAGLAFVLWALHRPRTRKAVQ